jgi:hypothetical protein
MQVAKILDFLGCKKPERRAAVSFSVLLAGTPDRW